MTDEQQTAYEALGVAIRQIGEAAAEVLRAAERAWRAIQEIIADAARVFVRVWRQWRAAHFIPRQYRDTMARRKMRRYVILMAQRN